ncbi:hypothetical protein KFE26_22320 [Shewanella sp. M16]|uniref:hypothetical protein n=1 Tax=Shewanella sp. M16 TaxID=2830837 RepID=UPI001BAED1EE|nr:hypothetical protein [Shewanella sp. M16]MBS0044991.1 hypothetical protein [Shewanella sp. M16]
MDNRTIGDAGEYLVAYNLSRRGLSAALMNTGTKGVDILVTDDGKSVASLQVKSSQGKSQPRQWMVGKKPPSPSDNFFYVFCNIWIDTERQPEVFIVPSAIIKDSVDWDAKVPLFKIKPEQESCFLNNWQPILSLFSYTEQTS